MRSILSGLFGHSPFTPLQSHMELVSQCVHKLYDLLEAIEQRDYAWQEKLMEEISHLEHQADLIKNDIRNHLPKSLFLPIDHNSLLQILSLQDDIADKAQDVAVLANLKQLQPIPSLKAELKQFLQKNIETFEEAHHIIKEFSELIGSSFGGIEAEGVRKVIEEVSRYEHEVDLVQRQLLKALFNAESQLSFTSFYQWIHLFESMGAISNISQNLANRVRMTLELQ